ncbi:MAG: hypothetical protein HYZ45_08520 [Burkholderiales bacterium]|nr:hypothetical protein [Burkholderiales bacterium]
MKRHLTFALGMATASLASVSYPATAHGLSDGPSEVSAIGSILVLAVPLAVLDMSGAVVVKSVDVSAQGATVVVRSVAKGAEASFNVVGQVSQDLSKAAGQSARLVVVGSGHLLVASGKVLAFIPNEIGKSMLYSNKVAQRGS